MAPHLPMVFPTVTTHRDAHTLCPLAQWHLLQQLLSTQWFLQAAILVRSTIIAVSQRPLLSWRFTHFGISAPLLISCSLALQQSTGLLSCLVGKNIHRLILFEWVMLFKKQTVNLLIGNYIHRVNVIKGSLYSQVYSMSCWRDEFFCTAGGSGLGKRQCMSIPIPFCSVQHNGSTCIVMYYV